jgi:hypothetical protein
MSHPFSVAMCDAISLARSVSMANVAGGTVWRQIVTSFSGSLPFLRNSNFPSNTRTLSSAPRPNGSSLRRHLAWKNRYRRNRSPMPQTVSYAFFRQHLKRHSSTCPTGKEPCSSKLEHTRQCVVTVSTRSHTVRSPRGGCCSDLGTFDTPSPSI